MPEKPTKFGIRPVPDVREAAGEEQPVILYCLACGHSRQMHAWAIAGLLGAASFGFIIGNLRCKQCGEKVGVVLPLQAPTPRAWAQVNRLKPPKGTEKTAPLPARVEPELHYKLETWTERGGIDRTLAFIDNLFIGHAAFNEAAVQYPAARITLRAGAHVLRDSARPD